MASSDFSTFMEEVKKAFVANKVRKEDQPSKLKESLKSHARKLIPESMKEIDTCWDTLKAVYGDPSRVMNAKKKKLSSMGRYPADELNNPTSSYLRQQMEWLLSLEVTIKEIIVLAEDDEEMEREAYGSSTFITINKMFPFSIQSFPFSIQ